MMSFAKGYNLCVWRTEPAIRKIAYLAFYLKRLPDAPYFFNMGGLNLPRPMIRIADGEAQL